MGVVEINKWFKDATRADVNDLLSKIILTERQELMKAIDKTIKE